MKLSPRTLDGDYGKDCEGGRDARRAGGGPGGGALGGREGSFHTDSTSRAPSFVNIFMVGYYLVIN